MGKAICRKRADHGQMGDGMEAGFKEQSPLKYLTAVLHPRFYPAGEAHGADSGAETSTLS